MMQEAPVVDPPFVEAYCNLLIMQYRDKPKTRAHIAAFVRGFLAATTLADKILSCYDIDQAKGIFLDVIGKIVGVARYVEHHVDKPYFGFEAGGLRRGMDSGKLFDFRTDTLYEESDLTDSQYRFFIRCKIAKNNASAKLSDQNRIALQDAIPFALDDQGYIVDNQDMTCTMFLYDTLDPILIEEIELRDLLPRPQGVRYFFQTIPPLAILGDESHNILVTEDGLGLMV